jgi:hypothetical protein
MDEQHRKIPVIESAKIGYTYLAQDWQRWIPAALVVGVATGAAQAITLSSQPGLSSLVAIAFNFAVSLAFATAVYKYLFRQEFKQPIGITVEKDELRVFAVQAGLMLIFGILLAFLVILIAIAALMMTANSGLDPTLAETDPNRFVEEFVAAMGEGGSAFLLVLLIVSGAAAIYVSVRLSLVTAATVFEERMLVFQTWGFTKNNVLPLLAVLLLIILPLVFVLGTVVSIIEAIIAGGSDPSNLGRYQILLIGFFEGLMSSAVGIAAAGALAHIYRLLRPSDDVIAKLAEDAKK